MTSVMSGVDLISWTVGPLLGVMTFLFYFPDHFDLVSPGES
ncbi:hypothetical protein CRD_02491 [Raphidiopsis brookii D9]|nr:hypothetical protein CRD_02491 [Raphidiopsis brookii D9]